MASEQIPRAPLHPVQTEGEVVHVPVHVVFGPEQVKPIKQSIQPYYPESYVRLRQLFQKPLKHTVDFRGEIALGHHS